MSVPSPIAPSRDISSGGSSGLTVVVAIGDGTDTVAGLAKAGYASDRALAAVASLELAGYIRREPGGRFTIMP